jgi:predicted dehydrogenase
LFEIVAAADATDRQRAELGRHASIVTMETAEALIDLPGIDAVVIATPAATHYELAERALRAGRHVLVEKPMCASAAEAKQLVELARSYGRVLMVDHTFLFTGAVQEISRRIRNGDLGRISYIDAIRVNLGPFARDVNVLWDLGPHDLSIVDYLLREEPIYIEASGHCQTDPGPGDLVYLTLHYPSGVVAHVNLSWISPVKVRRFAIGGSDKTLVWDDLSSQEKLKIYTPSIGLHESRKALMSEYRIGDIISPRLSSREALEGVVEHFGKVILGREESIMDGLSGFRIVRMLETAQRVLDQSLSKVRAARGRNRISVVGS